MISAAVHEVPVAYRSKSAVLRYSSSNSEVLRALKRLVTCTRYPVSVTRVVTAEYYIGIA